MLQTPSQVQRIIKKIAKHRSLVAVHLSDTPCLQQDQDDELYRYMTIKLRLREHVTEDRPDIASPLKQRARQENTRDNIE